MKKLVEKISLLVVVAMGITVGLIMLSSKPTFTSLVDMMTNSVKYKDMGKAETLGIAERAKWNNTTTKLIIGDSVANQLYEYRGNDEYFVMTGNMAMTVVWQYIFVRDFLEKHPQTTDVYLCATPDFFEKSFETKLSYSYMFVPLIETENMEVLEETQIELLKQMYGAFFLNPQVARLVSASGLNTKLYLNAVNKFYEFFPKRKVKVEKTDATDMVLAETYIMKIFELCKERNVTLHLIPNPKKDIPEYRKYLEQLEVKYRNSRLYEINPNYFEQIVFYPEECFKDELHFKDGFLEGKGKFDVIRAIQAATGMLKGLLEEE